MQFSTAIRRRDTILLFVTRTLRMFSYGFLSVILVLYLAGIGFDAVRIGALLTLTLAGDTLVSLFISVSADRVGRKAMLVIGALFICLAGIPFSLSRDFIVLLVAATIGVISPSGNEVGPFLAIEQAALSQIIDADARTAVFARYNLCGSLGSASGALAGGWIVQSLLASGLTAVASYRFLIIAYALSGVLLAFLFTLLSSSIEAPASSEKPSTPFGVSQRSRKRIIGLAGLFSIDAFGGGFVIQSIVAWWFTTRFGMPVGHIGTVFFAANIVAGISALAAARIAKRIGLVNTMVVTHIPSNILLILVPLMPNAALAVAVLIARFTISQMDVPTRQSLTMSIVEPGERSAAAGMTGVARTAGASLSPVFAGRLMAVPSLAGVPFIAAGCLKIIYDLLLLKSFRKIEREG